jgi:hypothetical protein
MIKWCPVICLTEIGCASRLQRPGDPANGVIVNIGNGCKTPDAAKIKYGPATFRRVHFQQSLPQTPA